MEKKGEEKEEERKGEEKRSWKGMRRMERKWRRKRKKNTKKKKLAVAAAATAQTKLEPQRDLNGSFFLVSERLSGCLSLVASLKTHQRATAGWKVHLTS